MQNIQHIPLEILDPPDFDSHFDTAPEADQEFVYSITLKGIIEPLIVRKVKKRFEIIAGSRRFRCAGRAGLSSAPCIVVKANDQEAEELKIHENLHRLDLTDIEQGRHFLHLQTKFNLTLDQIADITKKSISYISQHVTLLTSSDEILSSVHEKQISFSVARELQRIKDPDEQNRFLGYVRDSGATTRVVGMWVDEYLREEDQKPPDRSGPVTHSAPNVNPDPTFTCHTCLGRTEIKKMIVWKICPDCDFNLGNAVKEEIEKEKPPSDTVS